MKLSIITINLNNKDGLQKTIDSIVSQTFKDFEWIVIDGGSTDGSKELIELYANHFACWVSEPDKGVYNAMNKGIKVAKGEYINFMNSGDCYAKDDVLENLFGSPHAADVIYGYMTRDTVDGEFVNLPLMKNKLTWMDFYYDGLPHQSAFIKRQLFETYGYYDESLKAVSDWTFFVKVFVYHHATYEFVPLKISVYLSGGISDNIGLQEKEKERQKLFPAAVVDDIPKIILYDKLQENLLTRNILKALKKYSNLQKRWHKRDNL